MKLKNIYSKIFYILLFSLSYNQGFIFNSHESLNSEVLDDRGQVNNIEQSGFEGDYPQNIYYLYDDIINDDYELPLFISFWFLNNEPSKKQMYELSKIKQEYNDAIQVLSINTDNLRTLRSVKIYLEDKEYPFITLSDPRGRLLKKLGSKIMPYMLLVDNEGNIVKEYIGFHYGDEKMYKQDFQDLSNGTLDKKLLNDRKISNDKLKLLEHPLNRAIQTSLDKNKKNISIGYQLGFYRDTETIEVSEDSLVTESSYKKEFDLLFTFKDRYDLSFNLSNISNPNNGYINQVDCEYFQIKNTFYFHEKFPEEYVDQKNGKYDYGEKFEDLGNGHWDDGESFTDKKNNKYDLGEEFFDKPDGKWNEGEEYEDINDNGQYDEGEEFLDLPNGVWDIGEEYIDAVNGKWDDGEKFVDKGNGVWDIGEEYIDEVNGKWDDGETFTDKNNNNKYDKGFPVGFMLHFNFGASMPITEDLMRFAVLGVGINKKMEYKDYPIYPSVSFLNYSGYYYDEESKIDLNKSQIILKCPLKMSITNTQSTINSTTPIDYRGLWLTPSITINDKDAFFGLQFGLYRKF